MRPFSQRIVGAALLDVSLYEEVEADTTATSQAMTVVILASVATGFGVNVLPRGWPVSLLGAVAALIGWLVWAGLTYFIGTRLFPTPSTDSSWGELLRTTGFAMAPGILGILAAIPVVGLLIAFVVSIWTLVAFVIAVRQALDYTSTWRAVAVCLTGWVVSNVAVTLLLVLSWPLDLFDPAFLRFS